MGRSLISWVRFELGLTTVRMHGFLNLPPRLQDGDEVVVAGLRKSDVFEALACAKVGESDVELRDRLRAQQRRRAFWLGLALALVGVPMLIASLDGVTPAAMWQAGFVLLGLIVSTGTVYASYSRAELELELAIALGREGQPEESSSSRNSSRTHSSLSISDASSSASRLDG